ncbi:MAG: RdgB/HAM1 family non-canonical purine NTP pyrophosphatase [bacterium]
MGVRAMTSPDKKQSLSSSPIKTLIVASHNAHKVEEIRDILRDFSVRILSLSDLDWNIPIVEDGSTYYENALKKARVIVDHFGEPTLAEDSGLEVDALGGQPGIYSSRYAKEGASAEANNQKLLFALQDIPASQRTARYRCIAVLICPADGQIHSFEATCEGLITHAPEGDKGFGYDPLFLVPEYGQTFAELGDEVKNKISHRAKALAQLRNFLKISKNSC